MARRPAGAGAADDSRRDGGGLHLQRFVLCRDDGDAARPRRLRGRFQFDGGRYQIALRDRAAGDCRGMYRHRAAHVASRAARDHLLGASPLSGGTDRLRTVRDRVARRGHAHAGDDLRRGPFRARRDHAGAGSIDRLAGDQRADPGRPWRGVLSAGSGHCRVARGRRAAQRARQAGRCAGAGELPPRAAVSASSPAGFRSKWCRKPPPSACPFWSRSRRRRRWRCASRKPPGLP